MTVIAFPFHAVCCLRSTWPRPFRRRGDWRLVARVREMVHR